MNDPQGAPGVGTPQAPLLLVDDTPANILALQALLASAEHELVVAHSGREAVRLLEQRDFAVVLLDVQMPEMDGFETASLMKRIAGPGSQAPIIFVTGLDGSPRRVLRAYAEGGVDFIQKPLDPEIVRAKVSVFVELYRTRLRLVAEQARATRALQTMGELVFALADARSTEQVAAIIVEQCARVVQADACSLHVLDDGKTSLELRGHRGIAGELVAQIRRLDESSSPEAFAALRAGTGIWAETPEEYARLFPWLSAVKGSEGRAQAFWCLPLVMEGQAVGLLGMGFYAPRSFPRQERDLATTLAAQCGQALLRVIRREQEERARALLVTTLRSIGDAVIATDLEGRVTFLNGIAERLTGWSEADARGQRLEDVFAIHSEETRAASESPVTKVLREGTVVGLANHTVLRSRAGAEVPIDDSAAPIVDSTGAMLGVVLVFRDATPEKREQIRREFLARAGATLASSLDYRKTIAAVSQFAVPQLGDWCRVDLLEAGASAPQQVAVAHVDPDKTQLARALGEMYPPDPGAPRGAPAVIRSGQSELYPELPPALLEALAKDDEHLRILRGLKLESAMVVPLRGRERVLGAMTFVYADSGRRYTADDLGFAEEFARRAAMAIENAQAIEEARQTRQRYAALFEKSPFALALTSVATGLTVAVNQAFLDLFEVSRADVVGKINASLGTSDPGWRGELDAALREHGSVQGFEYLRQTSAGRPVRLSLNVDPVEVGGEAHLLTTIQDISIRTAQEQAIARALSSEKEARREAEAANLLKDEFLATMSHELRTPLNAILGWSSLLRQRGQDIKPSDRALATIERNAKAQARLIEDVLDVSRIITGKLRLDLQRVDVSAIVRASVEVVRPAAETKRVRLDADPAPQELSMVGDADRLQQIMWNLLSNAVKFTPSGGTVSVALGQSGSAVQIVVQDTGPGIAAEHLPFIFERFRQVDSSMTRKHGGLGLGLAIVRHLVELHGGSVAADSVGAGLGATFTVTLPVRALHASEARASAAAESEVERTRVASREGVSLSGVSVLVVDDDEDSRLLLESALSSLGAAVAVADCAEVAIAHLERHGVDVLISDIGMPGEDGLSLLRRVRQLGSPRARQVPAIALTAYARREDAARAAAAGYQSHITKPADLDTLVRTVARLATGSAPPAGADSSQDP